MASQQVPALRPTANELASGRQHLARYESISSANLTIDPNHTQSGPVESTIPSTPQFTITRQGELIFFADPMSESGLQHSSATAARNQTNIPPVSAQQREIELRREKKWLDMLVKWDTWKAKKEHVKQRARKGVPESLRGVFWPLFADSNQFRVMKYKELGLDSDSIEIGNLTQGMLVANTLNLSTSFDCNAFGSSPSFSGSLDERQSFVMPIGLGLAPKRTNPMTPNSTTRRLAPPSQVRVVQVHSGTGDDLLLRTSITQHKLIMPPPSTPTALQQRVTPPSLRLDPQQQQLQQLQLQLQLQQPLPIKRAVSNLSTAKATNIRSNNNNNNNNNNNINHNTNGPAGSDSKSTQDYSDSDLAPNTSPGNALQLPLTHSNTQLSDSQNYTIEPLQHSVSSGLIGAHVLHPHHKSSNKAVHHAQSQTGSNNLPFSSSTVSQFGIIPEHSESSQNPSTIPESPTSNFHPSSIIQVQGNTHQNNLSTSQSTCPGLLTSTDLHTNSSNTVLTVNAHSFQSSQLPLQSSARPAQSGPAFSAVNLTSPTHPPPPPPFQKQSSTSQTRENVYIATSPRSTVVHVAAHDPNNKSTAEEYDERSKDTTTTLEQTFSDDYVIISDPVPRTSIPIEQNKSNSSFNQPTSSSPPPLPYQLLQQQQQQVGVKSGVTKISPTSPTSTTFNLSQLPHLNASQYPSNGIIEDVQIDHDGYMEALPEHAPTTPSNTAQSQLQSDPVTIGVATPSKRQTRENNLNLQANTTDPHSLTKTGKDIDSISLASTEAAISTVQSQSPSSLVENIFTYTLSQGETPPSNWSYFKILASTTSPFDQLIGKDVRRTFTNHIIFSVSQNEASSKMNNTRARQSLADICRAYCHFDQDLGYCQGISFLVGTLLMYMEAEDAFWSLVALLQHSRYNLRGLFTTGFPLLSEYMFITKELMKKIDNKLYKHLEALEFSYSVCMPQWFMGLFVYTLPLTIGLRIWDILLYEGHKVLIRTALYMLCYYRDALLAEDTIDGIFSIMCHDVPQSTTMYADADAFIEGVHKVSFTSNDIAKLQLRFKIEKPPGPF